MAVTDESYFDWPVLPEAPSSLKVSATGNSAKLDWQVHGGGPTGIVVERRIDAGDAEKGSWSRIATLPATATEYSDSGFKQGKRFAYRVRAINADGESAYSNIVRGGPSAKP
jgi:hypothetical protein